MKPRWIMPLAALAGALFFNRKSSFASNAAGFGAPQTMTGMRSRWGAGRFGRRNRRSGPVSRLFGLMWGLFWIWFGLSFAFGGGASRNAFLGFFTNFGHTMARLFTDLFSSAGGLMQ